MSVCLSVRPSVRLSGTSLSKALNLHLSLQVSLRSVPGKSHVSPRSVPGQSQVSLRSVPGQSQGSPRSVSGQSQVRSLLGLSELTSSRRSLKYFVLFFHWELF